MSYEIHATHNNEAAAVVETGERYISAYEGMNNDGWVLSVDRTTHEGTLMSNDIDKPRAISKQEPFGNMMLDPGEALWLKACWMSILHADQQSIDELFQNAAVRYMRKVQEKMAQD